MADALFGAGAADVDWIDLPPCLKAWKSQASLAKVGLARVHLMKLLSPMTKRIHLHLCFSSFIQHFKSPLSYCNCIFRLSRISTAKYTQDVSATVIETVL